jgi:hypothetical protein
VCSLLRIPAFLERLEIGGKTHEDAKLLEGLDSVGHNKAGELHPSTLAAGNISDPGLIT